MTVVSEVLKVTVESPVIRLGDANQRQRPVARQSVFVKCRPSLEASSSSSSRLKSPSSRTRQILVAFDDSEIFLLTSHLYIHRRESCHDARFGEAAVD